jgi:hypothetical protein
MGIKEDIETSKVLYAKTAYIYIIESVTESHVDNWIKDNNIMLILSR